ncbi:MAG TPA: hypothetical protein VFW33_19545 [Gemmataceae bacterium]|nr:hypothetical protein [Gemmataceae bacterium]
MSDTSPIQVPETDEQRKALEERWAKRQAELKASAEKEHDDLNWHLQRSLEIAEGAKAPIDVRAKVGKQMGQEYLIARCPSCGEVAALSGEGKHLCRRCHAWLRYVREE